MVDFTKLSSYRYELPTELIAKHPLQERDRCKLLVLNKTKETIEHAMFYDLPHLLDENCHLVFNNSKVLPARLFGNKATGGKIEILLIEELHEKDLWKALLKPAKKVCVGSVIDISANLSVQVLGRHEDTFNIKLLGSSPFESVLTEGSMPLPPYIKRKAVQQDQQDYQTVYAKHYGSTAAPTAGLHFTKQLLRKLKDKRIGQSEVTLHVGPGTFLPVKVEDISRHKMHLEKLVIPKKAAEEINNAIQTDKKVIPVGTTALRALETACQKKRILKDGHYSSELFIYPPYQFAIADGLITNFHLPESTLMMLVTALGGYELIMEAYRRAIEKKYRFFSYGDAMLIRE